VRRIYVKSVRTPPIWGRLPQNAERATDSTIPEDLQGSHSRKTKREISPSYTETGAELSTILPKIEEWRMIYFLAWLALMSLLIVMAHRLENIKRQKERNYHVR